MARPSYAEPLIMFATIVRWFLIASITGAVVGAGTSVFLRCLFFSMDKTAHVVLAIQMALLLAGGLLNGLLLYFGYRGVPRGQDSVIAAIHQKAGVMPFRTGPIKPIAAILTLALGGSAGKEGPCAHIGGTLGYAVGRLLRLQPEIRKRLVICGISAGFASVFGTPLAGTLYGIEVLTMGQLRHDILFPSLVAGVTSYEVSQQFHIPYTYYPFHHVVAFSELLFMKMVLLGILFGLVAWLFIELHDRMKSLFGWVQQRFNLWPPLMPMLGSIALCCLIIMVPTDYLGLSLPLMNKALAGGHVAFLSFFWKSLFVAITLGSGFYGGIVTPQFVIGAAAGNVFASMVHVDPVLGACVGMVAVVAAASNTPIAAIVMGFELFGSSVGLYVVAGCITAYVLVGHRSVYPDQLVAYRKSLWMYLEPGLPLKNENIHVAYGFLRGVHRVKKPHHFHKKAK